MLLSVIIVNYQTLELTLQTIDSIRKSKGLDLSKVQIIVVDNNSMDGSDEIVEAYLKNVENSIFVKNQENLGFSKANNIGLQQSTGEYILFLNSDTIVQPDCIGKSIIFLQEHSTCGALTCRLVLANGTLDHACKRGFPTPEASMYYFLKFHKIWPKALRFGKYTTSSLSEFDTGEIEALSGAFMLIPKKVLAIVGNLDENFFMYGEDLDLCYRIRGYGYKIIYYSDVETIHLKGQSSKKKPYKIIFEFYRAMWLFYRKHYHDKYPVWVTVMVYTAISLLFLIASIKNSIKVILKNTRE